MSLLKELKRRHVFRVAAAYAIVGWVLIQVSATVVPLLHLPEVVATAIVLLVLVGFPVALVLAWAFDATPQGIMRTDGVSEEMGGAPMRRSRRAGVAVSLIGGLIAAIAGGSYWWWHRPPTVTPSTVTSHAAVVAAGAPSNAAVEGASSLRLAIPAKSIAVLPFENLSEDKANAYFASGMQNEILTRLASIRELKVISRTSTEQYASHPPNLRIVARQLGVATVLEGSVQKAGDAVRINVQLIQADDDSHLWAETYDRKFDNIFGVESEVATAIADALNAKLSGAEKTELARKPTDNPAAYDAYLRGLAMNAAGDSDDNERRTVTAYAEAVRQDPNFAQAWSHLAISRSLLYFNSLDVAENTPETVRQAADVALRLRPEIGETWLAQGYYRYRCLRDFPGALQAFREAQKRLPNNAQVLAAIAYVLRRIGQWEEALSTMQQAVELDPRNLTLLSDLGSTDFLVPMRRFDEARAVIDRALLIAPGNGRFIAAKAQTYLDEGRLEEAARLLDPLPLDSRDNEVVIARFDLLRNQGHFDAAIAQLQTLLPKPDEPLAYKQTGLATDLGYAQLRAGHAAAAHALFRRVIQTLKPTPAAIVRVDNIGLPMVLATAYAGIGDKQVALDQASKAVELYRNDAKLKPSAEATLAQVQARFGEADAAIAALPHLLQVPAGLVPGDLRFDPAWDPIRKDPRFKKLIAENNMAPMGPTP